jgi:signal transduction histidine kinase
VSKSRRQFRAALASASNGQDGPRPTEKFVRQRHGAVLGGVASGLASWLAVDLVLIRVAFVLVASAGGIGLIGYLIAWGVTELAPKTPTGVAPLRSTAASVDPASALSLAAISLGAILLANKVGLALPARYLWPLAATAAGFALVWPRLSDTVASGERERLLENGPRALGRSAMQLLSSDRSSITRVAAGGVLVVAGVSAFAIGDPSATALRSTLIALVIVGFGSALILGPWLVRLSRELSVERSARVRIQAQEEFAAHLHDSVLQTLAIIQRRADDPRQVVALARRQERELRAWLYEGVDATAPAERLAVALEIAAQDVESDHGVLVSVVCVGDADSDERVAALVAAAREAMVNAAKHSAADRIDVYAEVDEDVIEVFVRDRGKGFDPETIASDRQGVRQSIQARMDRVRGTATIHSQHGDGTEVVLRLPRHVAMPEQKQDTI